MPKSKAPTKSRWRSISELVHYFETQDMGESWVELPEANFDVDLKRRKYLVRIDDALMDELAEVAKSKKTSPIALINLWVKDRLGKLTTFNNDSVIENLSSVRHPGLGVFIIYKDRRNNYRWRLCSASNRVLADSAEGFKSKSACRREIDFIKKEFLNASIVDQTA